MLLRQYPDRLDVLVPPVPVRGVLVRPDGAHVELCVLLAVVEHVVHDAVALGVQACSGAISQMKFEGFALISLSSRTSSNGRPGGEADGGEDGLDVAGHGSALVEDGVEVGQVFLVLPGHQVVPEAVQHDQEELGAVRSCTIDSQMGKGEKKGKVLNDRHFLFSCLVFLNFAVDHEISKVRETSLNF